MQLRQDWHAQCAFVRDYFFGGQKKVAHQVAEYLARSYVGSGISELRPDTDVAAMIGDSIRQHINRDDFTLVRDDNLLADIDLKDSMSFQDLVQLVHAQRTCTP